MIEILKSFIAGLNADLKPNKPIRLAKVRNDKSIDLDFEVYAGINDSDSFSGYLKFPEKIKRSVSNDRESPCNNVYDCRIECQLILYFYDKDIYSVEARVSEFINDFHTDSNLTAFVVPTLSNFDSVEIWQRENSADTSVDERFHILEIVCEFHYNETFSICRTEIVCD